MFKVSLKGVLARKRRLLLTALAVIIGIAFLAGTFVFTDTIQQHVRQPLRRRLQEHRRLRPLVERDRGRLRQPAAATASRTPSSPRSRPVAGVAEAEGDVRASPASSARTASRSVTEQTAPPTLRRRSVYGGDLSPWTLRRGRPPTGADQVVIDKGSADKGKFALGDQVTDRRRQGGSQQFTLVGIAKFGDADSPGGATFALFDLPDGAGVRRPSPASSTPSLVKRRRLGQRRGAGPAHRGERSARRRDRGAHRRGDHQGEPVRHPEEPAVLHHLPARRSPSSPCSSSLLHDLQRRSRSSSPSASGRTRCCGPSAPAGARSSCRCCVESVVVGLVGSVIGLVARHAAGDGAEGGLSRPRPRHALERARPAAPHDHRHAHRRRCWSRCSRPCCRPCARAAVPPVAAMRDIALESSTSATKARLDHRAHRCSSCASALIRASACSPARPGCSAPAIPLICSSACSCSAR